MAPAASGGAAAESPSSPKTGTPADLSALIPVGTKVEARFKGGSTWYLAWVRGHSSDGRYNLEYFDGNKETYVLPDFVTRVKARTVGWNPNRAKEAAEKRKASGEAAPTALGSRPDAGKELHEWVVAEEAKEKAAAEAAAAKAAAEAAAAAAPLPAVSEEPPAAADAAAPAEAPAV